MFTHMCRQPLNLQTPSCSNNLVLSIETVLACVLSIVGLLDAWLGSNAEKGRSLSFCSALVSSKAGKPI